MRIGLIGDTHGWVPALEAALSVCHRAGADLVVHCGDFLSTPFSPDPPGETIALLKAEGARIVLGNGELYLRDWGTPRWDETLARRLRRPDPAGYFLDLVPAGQAELSVADLAWLRAQPEELVLDAARPGDVYVCHAMPGDPFSTFWDNHPRFTPSFAPGEIEAALSRPAVADADLILCGHVPGPLVQRQPLPNGRTALVVRGGHGHVRWLANYALLTHRGAVDAGFAAWEVAVGSEPFTPRDPDWRWDRPGRR